MNSAARCEIGNLRKINQDCIFVYNTQFGCLPNLYIVADGMGGHKSGEVASASAAEFFTQHIHDARDRGLVAAEDIADVLTAAAIYANKALYEMSLTSEDYSGMGTTLVCACVCEERLFAINVGDSRLYMIHDDSIVQKTHDHSYVMEMVKKGTITKEEAENHPIKNYLTRAVGTYDTVEIDAFAWPFAIGDYGLICSDGLTNMLTDQEIKEIVTADGTLETKVEALVDKANSNGGFDNISVILIQR